MDVAHFDLCIVGGGINGAGIARDAALRGLKVLLLEKGDFAGCTSSASSGMIHGGLRYLEFFEFGLVRKALAEREVMLRIAPQIVHPLTFCLPHKNTVRPAWMVRFGLFLYDHLGGKRSLPASGRIDARTHPYGHGLKPETGTCFTYADCHVDDARLVILNLRDAADHGADVRNYTACTSLSRTKDDWEVGFRDVLTGDAGHARARVVVNATGPYVRGFLAEAGFLPEIAPSVRLVQGAHILVPRVYEGEHAFLLQQDDRRVVFAFPYGDYTLCGTTETPFSGDPATAAATDAEKSYLCAALNDAFVKQTAPGDIIWSYAGVRPLFGSSSGDMRTQTRDYHLFLDRGDGGDAPLLLSIFGGKISTYRPLAQDVLDRLRSEFPTMGRGETALRPLPFCPVDVGGLPKDEDLLYFVRQEWARLPEDILWRRTKWGLTVPRPEIQAGMARVKEKFA